MPSAYLEAHRFTEDNYCSRFIALSYPVVTTIDLIVDRATSLATDTAMMTFILELRGDNDNDCNPIHTTGGPT